MDNNVQLPTPSSVLTFGIIGLAACEIPIVGLIFSILAIVKANTFRNNSTEVSGQVNTGRILGIVGLIASIIMIVVYIILIAGASAVRSYYY